MLVSSLPRAPGFRLRKLLVTFMVIVLVGATALGAAAAIGSSIYPDGISSGGSPSIRLVIALWFSGWLIADLYQPIPPRDTWHDIPSIVSSALQWGGLLFVMLVVLHSGDGELTLGGVLVLICIPSRITVRVLPQAIIQSFGLRVPARVLIVGSGQIAELVAASLLKYDPARTTVLGFVDDQSLIDDKSQVLGLPTYDVSHLDRLITARQVNHVVFAFSHLPDSALVKLMRVCQAHPNVEITLIPRFYEAMSPRTKFLDLYGLPHLHVRGRRRMTDSVLKLVFDRSVAAIALLLAAPILALAALAIRIEGPGPVFFGQQRVGRGGKLFTMYKLRSMRPPLAGEDVDGPSRYTGVGALLRRWSIDELPQLWNVLRGDMRIVGPRPEREEYVQLFSEQIPEYNHRHQVPGGITGLSQVMGLRGATSIIERSRIDNFYVENWDFWLDLRIIFLTFRSLMPLSQGIGGELMFLDLVAEMSKNYRLAPASRSGVAVEPEEPLCGAV